MDFHELYFSKNKFGVLFGINSSLWTEFECTAKNFNCLKRLESQYKESGIFLSTSSLKFLVLIWLTSEGWKTESTLELPSGFEHWTPRLGIQRLNHYATAPWIDHTLLDNTDFSLTQILVFGNASFNGIKTQK